jgi:hypothetical protein
METMIDLQKYADHANSYASRKDAPDDEVAAIKRSVEHDYELHAPNSARALREAREDNLDVVFPTDYQLQIDLDSDRAFDVYLAMRPLLEKYYHVREEKIRYSRSGAPKRHATINLNTAVSQGERLLLQVLMGSDRVREFLGLIQFNQGDPHPVLFLEAKQPEVPNAGSTLPDASGASNPIRI